MKEKPAVDNEIIRVVRNQYYREYRARNKEKIRAINQRYWERRAARVKEEKSDATSLKNK